MRISLTLVASCLVLASCASDPNRQPIKPSLNGLRQAMTEPGKIVDSPTGPVKLVKIEENGNTWGGIVPVKADGSADDSERSFGADDRLGAYFDQIEGCSLAKNASTVSVSGPDVAMFVGAINCGTPTQ